MPTEIERKFALPDGARITTLGSDFRLGERRTESLHAVYFDTPGFALARSRVTLRRRTGGHDAGWHLKLPDDLTGPDARQEIHAPLDAAPSRLLVPAHLRERVTDVVGYEPLAPVVTLRTRRVETPISTVRGRELAVLADDRVTATRAGQTTTWRELEVELTGGDPADLDRITVALVEAGAQTKDSPSKLVQALGDDLAAEADLTGDSPTEAVLLAYIGAQVGMIQGREPEVRIDAPDAVHKMRVAIRRLRSTLRTFRRLLDAERTEPLRAELKWIADKLGAARDAEVLKERLLTALAELPPAAVVGPVERRLTHELDAAHAAAHADVVKALDGRRYRAIADKLVGLLTDPPLLDTAPDPAVDGLEPGLGKARRRVTKRWNLADDAAGAERMHWAHEARKKAKAARYGWEAATPVFDAGGDVATAWEDVTEALGTAQDTVVARERLLELAAAARRAGEPDFTYGVLWAREAEHQQGAYAAGDAAIRQAAKATKRELTQRD